MLKAIFTTTEFTKSSDRKSLIVEGELQEGKIKAGMFLKIAFNPTFGMTVPIKRIEKRSADKIVLIVDCEDEEGVDFVEAMNFEHE